MYLVYIFDFTGTILETEKLGATNFVNVANVAAERKNFDCR